MRHSTRLEVSTHPFDQLQQGEPRGEGTLRETPRKAELPNRHDSCPFELPIGP